MDTGDIVGSVGEKRREKKTLLEKKIYWFIKANVLEKQEGLGNRFVNF